MPLQAQGAQVASDVLAAVRASSVVVMIVNDYASSHALLSTAEVSRALRGKLLLQLCSGSARQARTTAHWAHEHGIDYLDGAIMATPDFIGQPGCIILYGGAQPLFDKHRPLLHVLGGGAHYVGDDPGHASALDSALLMYLWGALFGVLQGSVVCEAEEIPLARYAEHLPALAAVVNGALDELVRRVARRGYAADEHTQASLVAHFGAFRHLLDTLREHELPSALPAAMNALFERAMKQGHAEDDFAVLHKFMAQRATRPSTPETVAASSNQ